RTPPGSRPIPMRVPGVGRKDATVCCDGDHKALSTGSRESASAAQDLLLHLFVASTAIFHRGAVGDGPDCRHPFPSPWRYLIRGTPSWPSACYASSANRDESVITRDVRKCQTDCACDLRPR